MKLDSSDKLNIVLLLFSLIFSLAFYEKLPDPVPTHWNIQGEVDGWTPKPFGAFVTPAAIAGLIILFWLIPAISPKGFKIEGFRRTYSIIKFIVVFAMFVIHIIAIASASGAPMNVEKFVPAIIGLLFIGLGNYMGKIKKNFFIGIRTPWTLSSDEVWLRTHRLGGKIFFYGGILVVLFTLLKLPGFISFSVIILVALIPVVYSYAVYKKIEGFSEST